MIVKIFANPVNYTLKTLYRFQPDEYLIGVDKGAYHALKNGLDLDLVLGDFDSTTEEEFLYIQKHAKKMETYDARKNETDSYLALRTALLLNPDEVILYGGIGKRFDHSYANMLLLKQGQVTFVTDDSEMMMLAPGSYHVENRYSYISFFAIEDIKRLTLKGFSYELTDYNLDIDDPLCVSNQGNGQVSFKQGLLLVVKNND